MAPCTRELFSEFVIGNQAFISNIHFGELSLILNRIYEPVWPKQAAQII